MPVLPETRFEDERDGRAGLSTATLKKHLETYIHGIELDAQAHHACLSNLNAVASSFSLSKIEWNVKNTNTLDVAEAYAGKMDFVVGNPPYVRVHNLEDSLSRVKRYRFYSGGMTDLYLVFYEIGLQMYQDGGRLCYIAPSSWFNSLAGHDMREFAKESGWLREIVDLGHFQPFNATAYTAIVLFEKSAGDTFSYKTSTVYRTSARQAIPFPKRAPCVKNADAPGRRVRGSF